MLQVNWWYFSEQVANKESIFSIISSNSDLQFLCGLKKQFYQKQKTLLKISWQKILQVINFEGPNQKIDEIDEFWIQKIDELISAD